MIAYIHGFNSSPASSKAQLIQARLAALGRGGEFAAPALPHSPREAMAQLERLGVANWAAVTLVGSSLGGFYATWLAEQHGCKAVLVNPAVDAPELLAGALGPQKNFHTGEEYLFTERHLEELRAFDVRRITRPERYLLLLTTGDEVLDYRRAVARYAGATQIVVQGGDHGFSDFAAWLDTVLDFAALGQKN